MDRPLVWMVGASALVWAACAALVAPESRVGVALGAIAPLAATVGSWCTLVRLRERAPERVSGAMIKFFAAKMVFFGVVVAVAVTRLPAGTRAFVASFVTQYIMLHFMEAFYLHRLFAGPGPRGRVD